MGFLRRLVLGRWFTRWLLRGGPWSIAAKLAAVALYGAWKWRRERKRVGPSRPAGEIEGSYEVLGPEPGTLEPGPGSSAAADGAA
jgi:hypothetical protein